MKPNAEVSTTFVEQTANELLGTPSKKLFYLVIETPKGKTMLNVGEKTHNSVKELTNTVTNLQFEEPQKPKQGGKL